MPENEPNPSPEEALIAATENMADILSGEYDSGLLTQAYDKIETAARDGRKAGVVNTADYFSMLLTNANNASEHARTAEDDTTADMFERLSRSYSETLRVLGATSLEGQKTNTSEIDMTRKKDNNPK